MIHFSHHHDVLKTLSLVCKKWHEILKEERTWRIFDLRVLNDIHFIKLITPAFRAHNSFTQVFGSQFNGLQILVMHLPLHINLNILPPNLILFDMIVESEYDYEGHHMHYIDHSIPIGLFQLTKLQYVHVGEYDIAKDLKTLIQNNKNLKTLRINSYLCSNWFTPSNIETLEINLNDDRGENDTQEMLIRKYDDIMWIVPETQTIIPNPFTLTQYCTKISENFKSVKTLIMMDFEIKESQLDIILSGMNDLRHINIDCEENLILPFIRHPQQYLRVLLNIIPIYQKYDFETYEKFFELHQYIRFTNFKYLPAGIALDLANFHKMLYNTECYRCAMNGGIEISNMVCSEPLLNIKYKILYGSLSYKETYTTYMKDHIKWIPIKDPKEIINLID
jgi:hypothetical protein